MAPALPALLKPRLLNATPELLAQKSRVRGGWRRACLRPQQMLVFLVGGPHENL